MVHAKLAQDYQAAKQGQHQKQVLGTWFFILCGKEKDKLKRLNLYIPPQMLLFRPARVFIRK
jgi:hypothetical protein